jgi:hypothetical protein
MDVFEFTLTPSWRLSRTACYLHADTLVQAAAGLAGRIGASQRRPEFLVSFFVVLLFLVCDLEKASFQKLL